MSEGLYSLRQTSELFGVPEARLRYWAQTGLVGPSQRQHGRFYYNFTDLVSLRAAIGLLDGGVSPQRVRKNLDALRRRLPDMAQPLARLRICSDGEELVVVDEDTAYQPATGQLVMAFAVRQLADRVATDVKPLHAAPPTAHGCFVAGVGALDAADDELAEALFRRALVLDGHLAAAWTNIGNILERRGEHGGAREAYDQALALDPDQPEARFNRANLLADAGEVELALAEYRRVAHAAPGLPDLHYNLAVTLLSIGAVTQAREHLALDPSLEARALLDRLLADDVVGQRA
jgi:tetratricopeptide (TPR) repeat protein